MAWRNLRARHRRAGLSFMTVVSIAGVCLGVAALIIVLSVMGGFENDLRSKMLRGKPHFEIFAKNSVAGFSLDEYPLKKFEEMFPQSSEVEAYVQVDVVLKHGSHLSSATLFGIQPDRQGHLWGFSDALTEGSFAGLSERHTPLLSFDEVEKKWPGIILGEGLAAQLGLNIGDELVVISPQGATDSSSVMAGGTLSRTYVVIGTFVTNMFNFDSRWAVTNIPEARKFMTDYDRTLDAENYVSGVAMNFKDPYVVNKVKSKLQSMGELQGQSWMDTNKALLFALLLEKFTMGAILMLIVVVAAFSISGTMMMNVFHRRTQVALLRSLGMTKKGIARLFLLHGMSISITGIIFGLLIGVGTCVLIHNFQFINLPQNVYYLKSLPVRFLPWNYVVIAVLALLLGLIGSIYPAFTAAKQPPSEGLRCN
jgi:lipoprotein-releasing system permease protein